MVTFKKLNLIERWPPIGPFDVVFCRNVLIYFDVETKRDIVGRIRRQLAPDGYLLLGGAETTIGLDDAFEPVPGLRTSCYRRHQRVRSAREIDAELPPTTGDLAHPGHVARSRIWRSFV